MPIDHEYEQHVVEMVLNTIRDIDPEIPVFRVDTNDIRIELDCQTTLTLRSEFVYEKD